MKVLDKATEGGIWAFNATNYYARSSSKPFRVVLNDSSSSNVKVGNDFKYTFKAENGKGKLVYAFFGLPEGVTANQKTGVISGKFPETGIYTLGCEVADQSGNSADGFLTVTVTGAQSKT